MKIVWSTVYIIVLGVLSHIIGELLPRSWFDETKFPYSSFSWEQDGKIYNRIKIRKWKNKLPDMSRIMRDMLPKRVDFDNDAEEIEAVIKETCVAECVHWVLAVLSFGIHIIWKKRIGLLVAAAVSLSHIPFIIIQRFNRPNLIKLRDRMNAREERLKCAC